METPNDMEQEIDDPEMHISGYSHLPAWRHRLLKASCALEGVSMGEVIGSCVENELADTPGLDLLESLSEGLRGRQRQLTPPKAKPVIETPAPAKNGKNGSKKH